MKRIHNFVFAQFKKKLSVENKPELKGYDITHKARTGLDSGKGCI